MCRFETRRGGSCRQDREHRAGEPCGQRCRRRGRGAVRHPHHGGLCRYLRRLRPLRPAYGSCLRLRSAERRQSQGCRCALRPHAQRAGPRRRVDHGARAPELRRGRQPGGAEPRGVVRQETLLDVQLHSLPQDPDAAARNGTQATRHQDAGRRARCPGGSRVGADARREGGGCGRGGPRRRRDGRGGLLPQRGTLHCLDPDGRLGHQPRHPDDERSGEARREPQAEIRLGRGRTGFGRPNSSASMAARPARRRTSCCATSPR